MLATALPVALASDRAVATSGRANASRGQYKIDIRKHVIYAVRVMLDAARVQYHRGLGLTVESRSSQNLFCRNAGDLCGNLR